MSGYQVFDRFPVQEGKYPDVFFGILITAVKPVLIKLIRGSSLGVQPNITAFALTKFTAVTFSDQWAGKGVSLTPLNPADKFGPGGDISPLVTPPICRVDPWFRYRCKKSYP